MVVTADVVVVGAGAAGLLAGIAALREAPGAEVILLEAGKRAERRDRRAIRRGTSELVTGEGGAGLFSDGKLCMSLNVGGEFPGRLTAAEQRDLLFEIAEELGVQQRVRRQPKSVPTSGRLTSTPYPVVHVGTDELPGLVRRLRDRFESLGGRVRCDTPVVGVSRASGGFIVRTSRRRLASIRSRSVVLAMGKVGSARQAGFLSELGVASRKQPLFVGVRVEVEASERLQSFCKGLDPKFKLAIPGGSKVKTHCVTVGGETLRLMYDGTAVAGSHATLSQEAAVHRPTKVGFGVLWNGADSSFMQLVHERGGSRLVAQRLSDLLADRPSSSSSVRACYPTTAQYEPGDLRRVLPANFFDPFHAFLEGLKVVEPALFEKDLLLFGPAVEWWAERTQVNEGFETGVPGLFSVGDGAGWSQGIVHAGACGLLAGRCVGRYLASHSRDGVLVAAS